ncbi:hypothetical protein OGCDGJMD_01221 [Cyanobium usitatum str. Tous]|nr:hypothetical protein OGCDGJMD_01221 [Cyanobium usitatum str. Tous]
MTAVSRNCRPVAHGPVIQGAEAQHLQAVQAALNVLAETGSWYVPRLLLDLALRGEDTVIGLADRNSLSRAATSTAIRQCSVGRYRKSTDPAKPGTVIPPALPGVIHLRKIHCRNTKMVALTPLGLQLVKGLLGTFPDTH